VSGNSSRRPFRKPENQPDARHRCQSSSRSRSPVATGVAISNKFSLAPGITYDITLDINPSANSFVFTVTNGTSTYTSSSDNDGQELSFRNRTGNAGSYLYFGGQNVQHGTSTILSIDGISVSQIPEPATAVAIAGIAGLLFALCIGRTRKQH
jgi:hypothetical protein